MPTATLGREPTEAIPNTCPFHRRKQVLGDALNIHNGFMIKNKYNTVSIAVILLAFYLGISDLNLVAKYFAGVGPSVVRELIFFFFAECRCGQEDTESVQNLVR